MSKKLRMIVENVNLITMHTSKGRFEEANRIKHDTNGIIHDMIRSNEVKYNQHWLEIHDSCQQVGIDTTELEIELSFNQVH